jgi:hypothetical protein
MFPVPFTLSVISRKPFLPRPKNYGTRWHATFGCFSGELMFSQVMHIRSSGESIVSLVIHHRELLVLGSWMSYLDAFVEETRYHLFMGSWQDCCERNDHKYVNARFVHYGKPFTVSCIIPNPDSTINNCKR